MMFFKRILKHISLIFPDGRIYITTQMHNDSIQNIIQWKCAVLGLCDPVQRGSDVIIDTAGWIRSAASESPYEWSGQVEKYLYAFWSKNTEEPYKNWTKASIMSVSDPSNQYISGQFKHCWNYFKRWYYLHNNFTLDAGTTIIQKYFIQLGTENSTVLPNIINSSVADTIADAYIAELVPSIVSNEMGTQDNFVLNQNYPNALFTSTTSRFEAISETQYSLNINHNY